MIFKYIYINIPQILRYSKMKYRAESGGWFLKMSQNVPADDRVLQFFPAEFSGTWVLTRILRIDSFEPLGPYRNT